MRWVKHEGYHETHQYVDDAGRIVAEIHGSHFELPDGWTAFDETVRPSVNLGRYTSLSHAKGAVEHHYHAVVIADTKVTA